MTRRVLLDGLARDADIFELVSELAPLRPRDNTLPGEVFLHLAADALDWCGASRADPLPLEGLRERFLPERTFRGRQNTRFQYAVLAAAALHGGTEPDLLCTLAEHRRITAAWELLLRFADTQSPAGTQGGSSWIFTLHPRAMVWMPDCRRRAVRWPLPRAVTWLRGARRRLGRARVRGCRSRRACGAIRWPPGRRACW